MKKLISRFITTLFLSVTLVTLAGGAYADEADLSPAAQSLWDAEVAFAASVADKDYEKFLSLIDGNAIFSGGAVLRGRDAIGEAWKAFFVEDGPTLVWEPASALVRPAGDIGTTNGPYVTTWKDEDGTTHRGKGMFFSIWEHQADGSWKIIFDGGTPPTPIEDE